MASLGDLDLAPWRHPTCAKPFTTASSIRDSTQRGVAEKCVGAYVVPANEKKAKEKSKRYTCRHCGLVASTKNELWAHGKVHIKKGSALECPHCAFVTKFKHHLDYHLSSHNGVKPFGCTHPNCAYRCINKSMLKSHMKSHVDSYQYRCNDCDYATKYAHSLKQHVRKYGHRAQGVAGRISASSDPGPAPNLAPAHNVKRNSCVELRTDHQHSGRHHSEVSLVAFQAEPSASTAMLAASENGRQFAATTMQNGWNHDPFQVGFLCDTLAIRRPSVESESKTFLDSLYGAPDTWNRLSSLRSAFSADTTSASAAIVPQSTARTVAPLIAMDESNLMQLPPSTIGAYIPASMTALPKSAQIRVVQQLTNTSDFRFPLPMRCDLDNDIPPLPFTL